MSGYGVAFGAGAGADDLAAESAAESGALARRARVAMKTIRHRGMAKRSERSVWGDKRGSSESLETERA